MAHLTLTFADGSTDRIVAANDEMLEDVLQRLVERKEPFASGWVVAQKNPNRLFNLVAVVSIDVVTDSGDPPRAAWVFV
jgi:hypothetical protein